MEAAIKVGIKANRKDSNQRRWRAEKTQGGTEGRMPGTKEFEPRATGGKHCL